MQEMFGKEKKTERKRRGVLLGIMVGLENETVFYLRVNTAAMAHPYVLGKLYW